MLMWGDSLGKLGAAYRYTRLLVQGVPISGRRERNGKRLLPERNVRRDRQNQRLFECRGQWQSNAPAILRKVRDTALQ